MVTSLFRGTMAGGLSGTRHGQLEVQRLAITLGTVNSKPLQDTQVDNDSGRLLDFRGSSSYSTLEESFTTLSSRFNHVDHIKALFRHGHIKEPLNGLEN